MIYLNESLYSLKCISNGDKGDVTPELLVATYEKALAMLL